MAIQMTCPFCKKEFPFENGELDREIARIGLRISQLNKRLGEIKNLPREQKNYSTKKERDNLTRELQERMLKASELKAYRKSVDQQKNLYSFMIFKELVKDKYGEPEYKKLLAQMEEELQAYQASGLMWNEYTRSAHKANVTSINKI